MAYIMKVKDISLDDDKNLTDFIWCKGTLCLTDPLTGMEMKPCNFLYQIDTEVLSLSGVEDFLAL